MGAPARPWEGGVGKILDRMYCYAPKFFWKESGCKMHLETVENLCSRTRLLKRSSVRQRHANFTLLHRSPPHPPPPVLTRRRAHIERKHRQLSAAAGFIKAKSTRGFPQDSAAVGVPPSPIACERTPSVGQSFAASPSTSSPTGTLITMDVTNETKAQLFRDVVWELLLLRLLLDKLAPPLIWVTPGQMCVWHIRGLGTGEKSSSVPGFAVTPSHGA